MRITRNQWLRCGITAAIVLTVGWGIWRCQTDRRFADVGVPSRRTLALEIATGELSFTSWPNGWPMHHSCVATVLNSRTAAVVRHERTVFWYGMITDVGTWCVMLIGAGWIAWQWSGSPRQFRLRTMFALCAVVAFLLGWWKYENDSRPGVGIVLGNRPMLELLFSPWYVYVPVLFGLGCGIYWTGWVASGSLRRIARAVHFAAPPKPQ